MVTYFKSEHATRLFSDKHNIRKRKASQPAMQYIGKDVL